MKKKMKTDLLHSRMPLVSNICLLLQFYITILFYNYYYTVCSIHSMIV